jgi:hypothetical protein
MTFSSIDFPNRELLADGRMTSGVVENTGESGFGQAQAPKTILPCIFTSLKIQGKS